MSEEKFSNQLLINMLQSLERKVTETNGTVKKISEDLGGLTIGFNLHEKRITDLEEERKSRDVKKKFSIDWKRGAIIGLFFIILEAITQYFITQLF